MSFELKNIKTKNQGSKMKNQILKFSNQYFYAYYHVTFDSEETYRNLFAKIKNELDLSSQEEFGMSQFVEDEEDYSYKLYKTEDLEVEDDSEIGYKMTESDGNG